MDRRPPALSVLIPSRGRPEKLCACLAGLAKQRDRQQSDTHFSAAAEVLVGLDGADLSTEDAARAAWREAGGRPRDLRVLTCARTGYVPVRHRLVQEARGRIMVSLNDDVRPDPCLLETHLREQATPAIVVGSAPYAAIESPTAIDRLVAETSWVFFFDVMNDEDRGRDWGFRHCFGLNFSAPLAAVRDAGGVPAVDDVYGYDDIELAFRLRPLPVRYRPEARVVHDHRCTAADLLRREHALGVAAWHYARLNPPFGRAVFDDDITSDAYRAACGRELDAQRDDAADRERAFLALDEVPGADVDPRELWTTFRPLKRFTWLGGLLCTTGAPSSRAARTPRAAARSLPRAASSI